MSILFSRSSRLLLSFPALVVSLVPLYGASKQTAMVSAHGQSFLGVWPHDIVVIDEEKEEVADRIDIGTDVAMGLMLSADQKKLYAFTPHASTLVTVDVATHKVIDSFSLDEGNREYRLAAGAVDSDGKYLYSVVVPEVKKVDRFQQESPIIIVVDLVQHKIVRTADFPKDQDIYGLAGLYVTYAPRLSPDNKYLYIFRNNILVFNTSDLKLIDTVELSKPVEPGMQTVALNLVDHPYARPGTVQSLFVSADPYVHRPVFGIATVDLATRNIEFRPVGPYTSPMMSLWVTPDGSTGYTVSFSGPPGNKRSEFWVFDMKTNQLVRKAEFAGRRRFDMALSPSGKALYIYVAGYTVECYDPQTLKLTKTIDLEADSTSNMVMAPGT